jgi:hypothetical protein
VALVLCVGATVATLLPAASSAGSEPSTTLVGAIPSTPMALDALCSESTTTTAAPTTTIAASLCDALTQLPQLPPDDADEEWDSVWDGTVNGSIQPVGCSSVSQTGSIVLIVLADGEVFGVGRTDSGAYGCDNGVDIPPTSLAYAIDGERTDRFSLTFEDGVTISSDPIVDGRAVLRQDTGFGVVTIELRCRGCPADATESTALGATRGS